MEGVTALRLQWVKQSYFLKINWILVLDKKNMENDTIYQKEMNDGVNLNGFIKRNGK